MFFAQPYNDPKGIFVDQVHSHDLVTSLPIILLIDTQSVRPDQSEVSPFRNLLSAVAKLAPMLTLTPLQRMATYLSSDPDK
jgi:hypothetical protein